MCCKYFSQPLFLVFCLCVSHRNDWVYVVKSISFFIYELWLEFIYLGLSSQVCVSKGPPHYHWGVSQRGLSVHKHQMWTCGTVTVLKVNLMRTGELIDKSPFLSSSWTSCLWCFTLYDLLEILCNWAIFCAPSSKQPPQLCAWYLLLFLPVFLFPSYLLLNHHTP